MNPSFSESLFLRSSQYLRARVLSNLSQMITEAKSHGADITIVEDADIEQYFSPLHSDPNRKSDDLGLYYRHTSHAIPIFMHKSWIFETLASLS